MRTINYRDGIRTVAQRWHDQYKLYINDSGDVITATTLYYKEVYNKLLALNVETCSTDDVDKCMGEKWHPTCSWVRLHCMNCEADVKEVIEFDIVTECGIKLCKNCVTEMLKSFKQ